MRKTIFLILALLIGLSLGASGALADSFIVNNTLVSRSDNPTVFANDGRVNPIQNAGTYDFNTYGATWNSGTNTLRIYTNWTNLNDGPPPFDNFVTTADLFLDTNHDGKYDTSVGLGLARLGNIYTGAVTDSWVNGGYVGGYNITSAANPVSHRVGVTMANDTGNDTTVTWSALGSYSTPVGNSHYYVDVYLGNLVSGNFTFLWASGTCANGPMEAQVPIPPTALLLGTGLLGLVGLGWRRRKS